MKKITILLLTVMSAITSRSQTTAVQTVFNSYIQLKDALVKSDAKLAADKAGVLLTNINQLSSGSLPANGQDNFNAIKNNLLTSATAIHKAVNIENQRIAFANLSDAMWKLVKNNTAFSGNVYYQYCPMKKTYWLSTEAAIKNPYYGSAMLNCGNIADKKNQ